MAKSGWLLGEVAYLLGLRSKSGSPALDTRTRPLEQLVTACSVLMSDTLGEGSTRKIADWAVQCYRQLDDDEKLKFFVELHETYSVDEIALEESFSEWQQSKNDSQLHKVFQAAEPPRQQLLRQLNHAPGATRHIVTMRADLRRLTRSMPSLKTLDEDFKHLLTSWFNPGFLTMREIRWGSSKALEQFLIEHERVHPIEGRAGLRHRMAPRDRYIYGFFHPAIGELPLIFVEVALTQGVPTTIESILENPKTIASSTADTAVFYSINNSFPGLVGISFGSFLIKQVIDAVRQELPQLENFVTFSPIPGFRAWLENHAIDPLWIQLKQQLEIECADVQPQELSDDQNNATCAVSGLEETMRQAVSHYLVNETRSDGKPVDPVGRFHLGNGASIWDIQWPGSNKPYSIEQSYGAMVNYRYDPEELERNHEMFVRHGQITISDHIEATLDEVPSRTASFHDERHS